MSASFSGWLQKKSKHIGSWRRRWCVLTRDILNTYSSNSTETNPTETIYLSNISTISSKKSNDFIFSIQCNGSNASFDFKADTINDKNKWITQIELFSTYIKIPVSIECLRNTEYGCQFELYIPYDDNTFIDKIIHDIIQHLELKHDPIKFVTKEIISDSFLGQHIVYNDYDWFDCSVKITDYPKQFVVKTGIHLLIDIEVYHHNVLSLNNPKCPQISNQNDLCPIYAKMRYQDIFTEEHLAHLNNFDHFNNDMKQIDCKYGDQCYAYKRLVKGGNELKDRCHIMIYRHPPRTQQVNLSADINSFALNDIWDENKPLYQPTEDDAMKYNHTDQNGYLFALIDEIIQHKYKFDLCLQCKSTDDCKHNDYSVLKIVEQKLKCCRHKRMGSPLNRAEILSILLYTGGDSNYDLCSSQRNGDYSKWKWFDLCLYSAILKLSKREKGHYKIYTGLSSVKLDYKHTESGYFKTYVSTSFIKAIALEFARNDGMIFEMDEDFRENSICCDVSWLSKFGLSECEILVARSIDAVFNNFECTVIDNNINEIQVVALSLYGNDKRKKQNQHAIKSNLISPMKVINDIRSIQGEDIDDFLDDEMIATLHVNMQMINQRKRLLVSGYLRQQADKLNDSFLSEIPVEIFYLVCMLYAFGDVYGNENVPTITDRDLRFGMRSYAWQSYNFASFREELIFIPYNNNHVDPLDLFSQDKTKLNSTYGVSALLIHGNPSNNPSFFMIMFHDGELGNAAAIWRSLTRSLPIHMLIVEYSGNGIMNGYYTPSEMRKLSNHVYKYVTDSNEKGGLGVDPMRLMILGRCIGSVPASYIAKRACYLLILVSPFCAINYVYKAKFKFKKKTFQPDFIFNNVAQIYKWQCKNVMIFHGKLDELIPYEHSKVMVNAINKTRSDLKPKQFLIDGVGYNEINPSYIGLRIFMQCQDDLLSNATINIESIVSYLHTPPIYNTSTNKVECKRLSSEQQEQMLYSNDMDQLKIINQWNEMQNKFDNYQSNLPTKVYHLSLLLK